jgi:hypothetical protein
VSRVIRAAVAILTIAAGAASLIRLRSLPIFGDEAEFLRFVPFLRADPIGQAWISIRAGAGPVHTWILAAVWSLSSDPVRAGRLAAVVAGILSIPLIAWCAAVIRQRLHPDANSGLAPLFAAALLAACPFLIWSQRIARVDSLVLAETILVAAASLRFADRIREETTRWRTFAAAAAFGLLMGFLMLTRTAVAYPFWVLLAAALWLTGTTFRTRTSRALAPFAVSLLVGFALFAPYLLAGGSENLSTRLFHFGVARPNFSLVARVELAAGNARVAWDSFSRYLSAPVFAAAAGSLALLGVWRRWRMLAYLLVWEAVALLPTMLFAGDYFPRYALPAAAPLLMAIAMALEEIRRRRMAVAAGLGFVLFAAGAIRSASFVRDWRTAPWTALDRWQLVSGWPAGASTEEAIALLRKQAAASPEGVLVITPEITGNPVDAVWALLESAPGIDLAFAMDALHAPLLAPAPQRPGWWQAREDLIRGGAARIFPIPGEKPVLFVTSDPILTSAGWRPAGDFFARLNPGLVPVARFQNPPPRPGAPPTDGVAVFSLSLAVR